MTNEEKLKQLDTDSLARVLVTIEYGLIPKLYSCNEYNCADCKKNFWCYTEWLKKEETK